MTKAGYIEWCANQHKPPTVSVINWERINRPVFQRWLRSIPACNLNPARWPDTDSRWPGQYKDLDVEWAWQAWMSGWYSRDQLQTPIKPTPLAMMKPLLKIARRGRQGPARGRQSI